MANTKITADNLAANAVTASSIADNSIGITQLNVSDGTNGQVLTTNGSGTLSFGDIPAGYTDSDVETYLNTSAIYTDATNDRLGIGTSSPSKLLSLSESADGTKLRITRAGVSEWDFSIGNTSTLTGVGSGALELLPQNANTANEFAIGTAGSSAPLFHLTNSQAYFAGNLLVGGTSTSVWQGAAGKKFIVSGSQNTVSSLQTSSTATDQGGIYDAYSTAVTSGSPALGSIAFLRSNTSTTACSSYTGFYTNNAGSVGERMRITSSGSVGINTSSPSSSYKLDVAGKGRFVNNADTAAITLERTAATTGAYLLGIDGDGAYRLSSASQVHQQIDDQGISYYRAYTDMTFGTGSSGTEKMRITSDGRVGIGTSSPISGIGLDVQAGSNKIRAGNIYVGSANGTRIEAGNGAIYPGDMRLLAGASGMDIDFQVVVTGIGVNTSARLDSPTGDWYTNDGSVSSLSDERVKTDITDLSDGLEIVKQLRPVTFKYNDNSEDEEGNKLMGAASDKVRYGFIAQEVEEVAPQYVETGIGYINNEEVDDFKSMSTTRMIPMLFKAIQEQQTIIDDLKARIETLENA